LHSLLGIALWSVGSLWREEDHLERYKKLCIVRGEERTTQKLENL
jgi:hypothetical protein